ncbi:Ankyrin repeat and fibronectin type-III domain-containing protein 1 [Pitangus sulphuratus]|nr:Ankyrin repeat and fibronectin type-III domain-containing protein 1 [Pitangus sulphuratus]
MPSSPNAAKRLYRNLSEKLKGSHTSFDEAYFRARSDRLSLRKTSMNFQCNEAMFEAVEQQDLDAVQILLYQYTLEELDLNTPNSEGLTPLDIAILTNNVPIAKTLLHVGAKESPHFVDVESRSVHLSTLVQEAQQRVTELSAQVGNEGLGSDTTEREKQLKAWEWRSRLYQRMKAGYEHARAPEAPTNVCLMVTSGTSLTVTFQEPLSVNSAVVTKYKVEWSSSEDFSPLAGEIILDNLQSLRCSITGLRTTGKTAVEENLGTGDTLRPWNASFSRFEQLISTIIAEGLEKTSLQKYQEEYTGMYRSLQKIFSCSTDCLACGAKISDNFALRGLYLCVILFYKDNLLVTNEDQIPIVEIDDSHSSSVMQDFLWFTKNLLGTHNLGRVFYEPIKDRHGNMLIVTVREVESLYSFFNGKWMQVSKLQSQRKSLSTPEEPTALDILLITIQDILSYHKRSQQRLPPGLYLGYLKLCSSVDQIKVLVLQKLPNVLCHVKIRDNSNVSKDEWEWIQTLSGSESVESMDHTSDCPTQLFLYELQTAVKALLKQINLPLHQQIDEIWREMRWITEALQYARYKQPAAGLPIRKLVDLSEEHPQKKMSSTSSHLDCLPSPPPSPEARIQRRKAVSDSQPCSDEEGCSEVFLPTDSDYDSSDALSPRELDLIYSSSQDISQQAGSGLGGSAPDVLQAHDMKPCLALQGGLTERGAFDPHAECCTESMSNLSMVGLTEKSTDKSSSSKQPLGFLGKKKLGKHQHYNYFGRQHRWLRVHSETQAGSLSEGVYTQHLMRSPDLSQEPTSGEQFKTPTDGSRSTFVPHASSLPEGEKGKYEEPRQNVHRIHVEPYETTFVHEEGKPWAVSTRPVGHADVHNAMQQTTGPDEQPGSAVPEVFSSTL